MNKTTKHTASFVSDYGKLWEFEFTMYNREEIEGVNWVRVDGKFFEVTTHKRSDAILNAAQKTINLFEIVADDLADRRDHHMVDDL